MKNTGARLPVEPASTIVELISVGDMRSPALGVGLSSAAYSSSRVRTTLLWFDNRIRPTTAGRLGTQNSFSTSISVNGAYESCT